MKKPAGGAGGRRLDVSEGVSFPWRLIQGEDHTTTAPWVYISDDIDSARGAGAPGRKEKRRHATPC